MPTPMQFSCQSEKLKEKYHFRFLKTLKSCSSFHVCVLWDQAALTLLEWIVDKKWKRYFSFSFSDCLCFLSKILSSYNYSRIAISFFKELEKITLKCPCVYIINITQETVKFIELPHINTSQKDILLSRYSFQGKKLSQTLILTCFFKILNIGSHFCF